MAKDFLYCEETDTKICNNDVVSIASYPNTKWIAKQGWYKEGTAQRNGWYFISLLDKTILPISLVDIKDISKDAVSGSTEVRPELPSEPIQDKPADFLYCEETDTKIYANDIVEVSDIKYVAKFGWYRYNDTQVEGWYFISLEDRTIVPLSEFNLSEAIKETIVGTSELRPTLRDVDATPPKVDFIVIPNTDIRLYDSDIVKLNNRPDLKWIVHNGWFIYNEVQNWGWYFVSIKDGEILPVSAIDLTLCSLDTLKTQGSELYDGKVVNYTRPFTLADAEILNRSFITLDTLEQRDNLDKKKIINGKMVRVNNDDGPANYYAWNAKTQTWDFLEVFGIPELVGTTENPIILSELESALYRVKGTYKISPAHPTTYLTAIDHLAFVAEGEDVNIKVITEHNIADYIVEGDEVIFINNYATVKYVEENYATKVYVDNKIAVLEGQISEIISEFPEKVRAIVYEILDDALNGIEEEYIDNLFS